MRKDGKKEEEREGSNVCAHVNMQLLGYAHPGKFLKLDALTLLLKRTIWAKAASGIFPSVEYPDLQVHVDKNTQASPA